MEFADANINYHHLNLLCDRMCMKMILPIFRSGILNDDIGPIAKATFEVHTEVLLNAARHAEFDHMRGVSANIMCGQYGNYGTGSFNIILDLDEMKKIPPKVDEDNCNINNLFDINSETNKECSTKNIKITNNINNLKNSDQNAVCNDDYDMGF